MSFDLSLGLDGTHVLITGGAGMIGQRVVLAFLSAGANVSVLDISPHKLELCHPDLLVLHTDISSESSVQEAFRKAKERFGIVRCCVALAGLDLSVLPHCESLLDMELAQWRRTMEVNVQGTFLTAREWMRGLRSAKEEGMTNVGLIIVGSESGWFGERGNADYATSKAGLQVGLLQSLKADVIRVYPRARVNAIAPGPVDTPQFRLECSQNPSQLYLDAEATCALGEPVPMDAVARGIVYLASERWSGHVMGQVLSVDSGKVGKVMWREGERAKL